MCPRPIERRSPPRRHASGVRRSGRRHRELLRRGRALGRRRLHRLLLRRLGTRALRLRAGTRGRRPRDTRLLRGWRDAGPLHRHRARLLHRRGTRLHRREAVQELLDTYAGELTAIAEHCRGVTEAEFTPSDFPNARLSQSALDMFLTQLSGDPGESR